MKQKFEDLGLSRSVLSAITRLGYENPSKIQEQIIPCILKGQDVIGQAQTGTGKTLAYAATILSMMNVETNLVKAIILTPTRELALQVSTEFEGLNNNKEFQILPVYGGSSIELQLRALRKGVDIVVGTPGRVMDLIKRKALKLDYLDFFVLDEADEMLNMGFLEDIEFIFKKTNAKKQVLLFSATMPASIEKLASRYMKVDYEHITIEEKSRTSINVKQYYYFVGQKEKIEALSRVIDARNPNLAIIFCQTKKEVDRVFTELSKRGYSVEAMHGDIAQSMRIQTLERFKAGAFHYLVATDVAARGIHIDDIDCVINYDLPQDVESYIHRIGRTGRASKKGEAVSFVTPKEVRFLSDVEKQAKCKIQKAELPQFEEVFTSKYNGILREVETILQNKENEECIPLVRDKNKDELMYFSSALLKLLLQKQMGSDFRKEITVKPRKEITSDGSSTRVFLTIGKIDHLKKGTLLDFLKEETGIRKEHFHEIEILSKFTFMNVDSEVLDEFINKVYNKKLNDRIIRVEKAKKR